jgi:DNA-binding HxlR family transcriptional regulator
LGAQEIKNSVVPGDPAVWERGAQVTADWCEDADVMTAVVSRKWVVPVLGELTDGPLRHNNLHRAVGRGIHPTVLDATLRHLELTGLVRRETTPGTPPATWYQLTDLGWSLVAALTQMARWVEEHRTELAVLKRWAVKTDKKVTIQ